MIENMIGLDAYLKSLIPVRELEMQRMEEKARHSGFPIIGPEAGYFCYQVARMISARKVFELGSGFGYSTAWFAKAVVENGGGTVHHVVWNDSLSQQARKHLGVLGYDHVIEYHVGEAVETLRNTPGQFDLIFNDIDKEGYPDSLEVIAKKLRKGGVLITDNVLWGGRVMDENDFSPTTVAIRKFTQMLVSNPMWVVSIVPLRDGLLLAYKVS